MKMSMILRLALLAAPSALIIGLDFAFADRSLEFKPNWFTIIPFAVVYLAVVGVIIRNKSAARDSAREANAGLSPIGNSVASPNEA